MKKNMRKVIAILCIVVAFAASVAMHVCAASNKEDQAMTQTQEWVYPEDVIDAFEKELGYRPKYWLEKEVYHGEYDLLIDCNRHGIVTFITAQACDYEGWRITRSDLEKEIEKRQFIFSVPVVEIGNNTYYTTDEIETLFREHYGYNVNVYIDKYFREDKLVADFVIYDRLNGIELEVDALLTTEGWMVPESNWYWFTENFALEEEVEYATNFMWKTLSVMVEEFEYMLGVAPEIEVHQNSDYEWMYTIYLKFDHLGGKRYRLKYAWDNSEDILVSSKVYKRFLEENPEITYVVEINDEEELEIMYNFYKNWLNS